MPRGAAARPPARCDPLADDTRQRAFAAELRKVLRGRSPADQRRLLVGVLNKHLPKGERAVLVGGGSVEFYTLGGYTTSDVDLIGDRESIARLLLEAGFEGRGRVLKSPEFGLYAEVPGSTLRPTEEVALQTFEGYEIPIVRVEDIIVDRLRAAKFWKSEADWEQALMLFAGHRSRLSMKDLAEKARGNEVDDFLAQLEAAARR